MPDKARFEVYQDSAGEWRWRLIVLNGNIIAASGEGYASKQGAKRGISSVKENVQNAEVKIVE